MTMRELAQLQWLRGEAEELERELSRLSADAASPASPSAAGSRARGRRRDRMAEYAGLQETLRERMEDRRRRAVEEHIRLEAYIAAVPDSLTRRILFLHFARGYSWGRTARELGGGNTAQGVRMRVYRLLHGPQGGVKNKAHKKRPGRCLPDGTDPAGKPG